MIVLDRLGLGGHYFSHPMETTGIVEAKRGRTGPSAIFPPFHPPPLLRNPHVQTVIASRKPRRWWFGWRSSERMEIHLGRDGKILTEVSWQPGRRSESPALFLLHGLEGSADSHYLLGISRKAFDAGFHTVRVNTRNCGNTEHMTTTLYCAGLSQDVSAIVRHLQEECGIGEIYAGAVSLGGNILLKYLGEEGERALEKLRGAAVVSVPVDLKQCALRMEAPQNWIYQRHFLERLKERVRRKRVYFPKIADPLRLEQVRTIYEFDDAITAPHFGWGTAENYYRLASSAPLLRKIRVPTLIIQSRDDPLIPFEIFRQVKPETNPCIDFVATEYGGHSGFLGIKPAVAEDQDAYWAECRVVQFLSLLAGETGRPPNSRMKEIEGV